MKLDILAIGAHPDDVELGCSATLAKEISKGKKIGILDLTRGELGTRGSAKIRDKEAKDAAEILGACVRHNLAFKDGFFENNAKNQLEIIKILRKYQPEMVICNAVEDRHIDHGKGAKLVIDACFLSGLRKIETLMDDEKQEAWRPKTMYHYIQWKNLTPDVVVDVSRFMDKKMACIKAYRSQFFDKNNKEPNTPISDSNFFESITYRAKDLGRLVGVDHAEGFTVNRLMAVDSLFDLK